MRPVLLFGEADTASGGENRFGYRVSRPTLEMRAERQPKGPVSRQGASPRLPGVPHCVRRGGSRPVGFLNRRMECEKCGLSSGRKAVRQALDHVLDQLVALERR